MRRFLLVGALCAILGLTAAACKRPVPPRLLHRHRHRLRRAPPPPPPPKPAPPPPPPPAPLTEDQIFAQKTVDQLNAERPLGDVLFDYDSSTLRDDGRAAASRNADYLKRWTSVRITVEGHADARGTSEYNLALGERRAAAVKEYSSASAFRPIASRRSARARNSRCARKRPRPAGSGTAAGFHIITAK